MYILPECVVSIKSKWLNKDDTESPNDEKFWHDNVTPFLMPVLQKTSIRLFKRFSIAKRPGEIYIDMVYFRYGQFNGGFMT